MRVDIPDETGPYFERLHGEVGEVVSVLADDVGQSTWDEREDTSDRLALADRETTVDVAWRDRAC